MVERIYNRVSPNGIAEDVKNLSMHISTTLSSVSNVVESKRSGRSAAEWVYLTRRKDQRIA